MAAESPLVYLNVEVEPKGDRYLVHCRGKLIAGVCGTLYQKVHGLIPDGKQIVLDLSDLEWIDSTGIGTLIRIHAGCRYAGCRLQLIHMGKRVKELLGLTGLLGVFAGTGDSSAEAQ
jgi:anti-sigma B factor antagonist